MNKDDTTMRVTHHQEAHAQTCAEAETVPLDRSAARIVSTLVRVADQSPVPVLWPESGTASVEVVQRREWSRELEGHFREMRRRARVTGPATMLPMFEEKLFELEALVRGAVSGRVSCFLSVSDLIREVEDFQRRWSGWIEPLPAPPPRVRYNEADRSLWLDGTCVARELDRKQFGFVRVLVDRYPDPVTWNVITQAGTGCLGGNQTRLRKSLPRPVKNLIESGPDGYALRLPEKLSAAV